MNVIKFMANQDDVVKMHYVQTLQALLLVSVRPDTLATQRPNVLMLMNVPDLMHVVVGLLVKILWPGFEGRLYNFGNIKGIFSVEISSCPFAKYSSDVFLLISKLPTNPVVL